MILIYPPVAKICEPPGGVAFLAGALKHHGVHCITIDANLEALLWLGKSNCHNVHSIEDKWTRRALSHFRRNLSDLKCPGLYKNIDRYRQRVMDVNRVISTATSERFKITLADYHDTRLLPVKSKDLLSSAENFMENPFYNYFEDELVKRIDHPWPNYVGLDYTESKEIASNGIDLDDIRTDYIGISICYLSQALTGFALAGWIRTRFPQKKIIMGGGLVTSWMSFPHWKNPFGDLIDFMVKGQGEDALLDITGVDIKGRERSLPDFDFSDWNSYLAPYRILPYRASTGCHWHKCRFCPERAEKSHYKPEKVSDVLSDLEILSRRYHPGAVHFLDNSLSFSLLKSLAKRKMPFLWYGFVRFIKEFADPEFVRALYDSGCRMLKLGLESGDQQVLDHMHKGTDLDTVSNVLTSIKNAGIASYVYLLFGTLHETEYSAEKTLSYVAEHSDRIDFINTAIFNLPRFSEDAESLETEGFYNGDLSLYLDFIHPVGWNRKKVRTFLSKEFKKNFLVAPVLRNVPPFFTSNHAMFFERVDH